jgi:WD40 repeat protein
MTPGGSDEPSVVAGEPEASLLYHLIIEPDEDNRMPQKDDPLSPGQVSLIEEWIVSGAAFDGPSQKAPLAAYAGPSDHPAPPRVYPSPMPIVSLAFSPDGKELAVGGYHEVMIWNPIEGRLLRRLTNIAERVHGLAWSTNHEWLAVAGGTPGRGGDIRVLHADSGSLIRLLGRTVDSVLGVRFSPDESRLVAFGADNAVRFYNTTDWTQDLVIEQHADWVMDARFDRAGERVVTASRDKSARVFDVGTGELIESFFGHEQPVFAAMFDTDQDRIWSAGKDRRLRLWEIKEAKQKADIRGFEEEVARLLWFDGKLISATANLICEHDAEGKRQLIRKFEGHGDRVYALAISPVSGWLASGDHQGEVRVWNLEDGSLLLRFLAAPGLKIE